MKIGFIGGGNMASALISRISTISNAPEIHVTERNDKKLAALVKEYSVVPHNGAGDWLTALDCVILAVKPQDLPTAIAEIKPFLGEGLILSIAAGVQTADLAKLTGKNKICRVMPNTPVKTGLGICGVFLTEEAKNCKDMVEFLLKPTGEIIWCEKESMIESITCISGSGPAYVFIFLETFEKAALSQGFSAEQARELAIYTVLGSVTLAKSSPLSFTELSQAVQSKGGTTIEAVKVMEENGFQEILLEAMLACKSRAIELGNEFSQKLNGN